MDYTMECDFYVDLKDAYVCCVNVDNNFSRAIKADSLNMSIDEIKKHIDIKARTRLNNEMADNAYDVTIIYYGEQQKAKTCASNAFEKIVKSKGATSFLEIMKEIRKLDENQRVIASKLYANQLEFQTKLWRSMNAFATKITSIEEICKNLTTTCDLIAEDWVRNSAISPTTPTTPDVLVDKTIEASQKASTSSQDSTATSTSYVPKGFKKVPAASGFHNLKHPPAINRFVPSVPQDLRAAAAKVIKAARENHKWLLKLEDFVIEGVEPLKLKRIRHELKNGSDDVSIIARKVAGILFSEEHLIEYRLGYCDNEMARRNASRKNTRPTMEQQYTDQMKKIFQFIDEFFIREEVWTTLIREPVNQLGRDKKPKTSS